MMDYTRNYKLKISFPHQGNSDQCLITSNSEASRTVSDNLFTVKWLGGVLVIVVERAVNLGYQHTKHGQATVF